MTSMRAAGPACSGDLLRPLGERGEQVGIDLQSGAATVAGPKMQRTVDLAAPHCARDGLAKIRLGRAKFLGQPAADFEKSVIDGLQLPGEQTPRDTDARAAQSRSCYES